MRRECADNAGGGSSGERAIGPSVVAGGMSLDVGTVADDRVASDACLVRLSITVRKKCTRTVAAIATHSDR